MPTCWKPRQEDHEFKASLSCIANCSLKKSKGAYAKLWIWVISFDTHTHTQRKQKAACAISIVHICLLQNEHTIMSPILRSRNTVNPKSSQPCLLHHSAHTLPTKRRGAACCYTSSKTNTQSTLRLQMCWGSFIAIPERENKTKQEWADRRRKHSMNDH